MAVLSDCLKFILAAALSFNCKWIILRQLKNSFPITIPYSSWNLSRRPKVGVRGARKCGVKCFSAFDGPKALRTGSSVALMHKEANALRNLARLTSLILRSYWDKEKGALSFFLSSFFLTALFPDNPIEVGMVGWVGFFVFLFMGRYEALQKVNQRSTSYN